jgi:hypothetical protein
VSAIVVGGCLGLAALSWWAAAIAGVLAAVVVVTLVLRQHLHGAEMTYTGLGAILGAGSAGGVWLLVETNRGWTLTALGIVVVVGLSYGALPSRFRTSFEWDVPAEKDADRWRFERYIAAADARAWVIRGALTFLVALALGALALLSQLDEDDNFQQAL